MARATSTGRLFVSPVDENHAIELGRCDHSGHGHARAHRVGELALVEHHGLAGGEIGGDRAVGNRQVLELGHTGHAREATKHRL
jgi:hypothetical protein